MLQILSSYHLDYTVQLPRVCSFAHHWLQQRTRNRGRNMIGYSLGHLSMYSFSIYQSTAFCQFFNGKVEVRHYRKSSLYLCFCEMAVKNVSCSVEMSKKIAFWHKCQRMYGSFCLTFIFTNYCTLYYSTEKLYCVLLLMIKQSS